MSRPPEVMWIFKIYIATSNVPSLKSWRARISLPLPSHSTPTWTHMVLWWGNAKNFPLVLLPGKLPPRRTDPSNPKRDIFLLVNFFTGWQSMGFVFEKKKKRQPFSIRDFSRVPDAFVWKDMSHMQSERRSTDFHSNLHNHVEKWKKFRSRIILKLNKEQNSV